MLSTHPKRKDKVMTLEEFVAENKITLTFTRVASNPHMPDFDADHYKVNIHHNKSWVSVYYSKGLGHKGAPPTTAEVLECLASDGAAISNAGGNFEDWAADMGYDADSRKAEKIFKTCEKQARRLHSFLGDDLYDRLLFDLDND
jgi:hypothetical protein